MNGFEADKGKEESADLRRCLPSGHGKQSSLSASNPTQKRSQRRRNGFCPPKIHALSTNEKTAAIIKKRGIFKTDKSRCEALYTEKETLK